MRWLHWRQRLTVAVVLSLTLLIVGVVGLGEAIQEGVVRPRTLNMWYAGMKR